MEHERLRIVRVEIEYDRYDNVVMFYNLDKLGIDANPYNLFRNNEPLGLTTVSVTVRLLTDEEWDQYKETGKVGDETVWEGFPD